MGRRGPKPRPGERNKKHNNRLTDEARQQAFDKEQRETMSIGISARMRHYGLTERAASDQLAGSVIGRLCRSGAISVPQYDAGMQYLADCTAYRRRDGHVREVTAHDLNRVHGLSVLSEHEQIEAAQRAKARYAAARQVVSDEQRSIGGYGNLFAAIEVMIFRDQYVASLEGDLRVALNALARHYGLLAKQVLSA